MRKQAKPDWSEFPEGLRELFGDLWQDVASLHAKWTTYWDLYGDPERIVVLNETGMAFFQTVEEALRMDMIMSFSRLLDPPRSSGKENLSLARFVNEIKPHLGETKHAAVEAGLKAVRDHCDPIIAWRNRRVGHNDLATALKHHAEPLPHIAPSYLNKALEMLAGLMNQVERHFHDGETMYSRPLLRGDAKAVIFYLEQALEYHEKQREAAYGNRNRSLA